MIEVKEIIKSYGNSDNKIQVLKGISLKIRGRFCCYFRSIRLRKVNFSKCSFGT